MRLATRYASLFYAPRSLCRHPFKGFYTARRGEASRGLTGQTVVPLRTFVREVILHRSAALVICDDGRPTRHFRRCSSARRVTPAPSPFITRLDGNGERIRNRDRSRGGHSLARHRFGIP